MDFRDSDEVFAVIAGYTDGGAAYGVTWDELGRDPVEEEMDPDPFGCVRPAFDAVASPGEDEPA